MTETRLGTMPLGRLILQLAVPSTIAQLVNLLYSLVDKIYIGHMSRDGSLALTGLGLCAPIIWLILAFNAFAVASGSSMASIALGHGDRDRAEKFLGNSTVMLLFFSVILTVFFLLFKIPILYASGASDNTIGYADEYITIYLCGTLFVQLSLGLNSFIICQGRARTALLSVLIGAVSNIILDPIFIFTLRMGISGAALATVISQTFSAVWIVLFLCSKRSAVRIKIKYLVPDSSVCLRIASLGISPFISNITECLIFFVFNRQLQAYGGDTYISAMTVIQSVMQIYGMSMGGFIVGIQPIIGYNYGAGKYDRVLKCFWRMLIATLSVSMLFFLTSTFFPAFYARIFTDDAELIAIVKKALPVFISTLWIFGLLSSVQSTFLALGQAKRSLFVACLRKVILMAPLTMILPNFFGVMGIFMTEPISDFVGATAAGLLFLPVYRKLKRGTALDAQAVNDSCRVS